MNLTKIDRQILDSYASMIEGLSMYLGSVYEISLHSLEDYDHSVVKIMNGYHSGRTVGAPLTDLALNMLKRIKDQGISSGKDFTSYTAINALGESLKSSTIPILGQNNRVIGVLCINLYAENTDHTVILHKFVSGFSIVRSTGIHYRAKRCSHRTGKFCKRYDRCFHRIHQQRPQPGNVKQ